MTERFRVEEIIEPNVAEGKETKKVQVTVTREHRLVILKEDPGGEFPLDLCRAAERGAAVFDLREAVELNKHAETEVEA